MATSGIIVTSEPVRVRIVGVDALHVGGDQLDQAVDGGVGRTLKGTTTAKWDLRIAARGTQEDRNAMINRQVRRAVHVTIGAVNR